MHIAPRPNKCSASVSASNRLAQPASRPEWKASAALKTWHSARWAVGGRCWEAAAALAGGHLHGDELTAAHISSSDHWTVATLAEQPGLSNLVAVDEQRG